MSNIFQPYVNRHEQILKNIIDTSNIPAIKLRDCVNYALFPGGKKLRALLVYLCGEIVELDINALDIIAVAVELVHCYSLIHDDLPSMDNDDLRRGKHSCHKAFDEATAILVGDGLQNLAFSILLQYLPEHLNAEKVVQVTHELIKASGFDGMVSGQSLDLTELKIPVDKQRLSYIHSLKTGQLFLACIKMVIASKNVDLNLSNNLIKLGNTLGILYQVQDDYLDRYYSHLIGKTGSSDQINDKVTFATLYSKTELENLMQDHYLLANNYLHKIHKSQNLIKFLDFLQIRLTLNSTVT